jgi:hypothetical protein
MTAPHSDPHGIQQPPHGIQHAPGGAPVLPPGSFTWEEWLEFQRSDLGAGKVVVALMASIFVIGFFLYGAIALIVSQ